MKQNSYEILDLSHIIIYHVYSVIFNTFFIFFILSSHLFWLVLLGVALFGVIFRILLNIIK